MTQAEEEIGCRQQNAFALTLELRLLFRPQELLKLSGNRF